MRQCPPLAHACSAAKKFCDGRCCDEMRGRPAKHACCIFPCFSQRCLGHLPASARPLSPTGCRLRQEARNKYGGTLARPALAGLPALPVSVLQWREKRQSYPTSPWAISDQVAAQTTAGSHQGGDGYIGYNLEQNGDPEAATYRTENTDTAGVELPTEPDVYLNASVSVREISIEVENITAKVNLDAQVLKLLHFNAGVDASIDRVRLSIQNVTAKVELEARLGNLLQMVSDVLDSIDLNPIVATLGRTIGGVINGTTGIIDGGNGNGNGNGGGRGDSSGSTVQKRSLEYNLAYNILFSVNDYSGRNHRNRILAQNGSIYDVYLDNNGRERSRQLAGDYRRDMTFTGHNKTIEHDGVPVERELQYLYSPYTGLEIVALVYMDIVSARVVRTNVVAGAEAGGSSYINGQHGGS
ncbi:hypothetical protein RB597_007552 [Gaeumannomyces tritici]